MSTSIDDFDEMDGKPPSRTTVSNTTRCPEGASWAPVLEESVLLIIGQGIKPVLRETFGAPLVVFLPAGTEVPPCLSSTSAPGTLEKLLNHPLGRALYNYQSMTEQHMTDTGRVKSDYDRALQISAQIDATFRPRFAHALSAASWGGDAASGVFDPGSGSGVIKGSPVMALTRNGLGVVVHGRDDLKFGASLAYCEARGWDALVARAQQQAAEAAKQEQEAKGQCEKSATCIRGFNHQGRGGSCSDGTEKDAAARLKRTWDEDKASREESRAAEAAAAAAAAPSAADFGLTSSVKARFDELIAMGQTEFSKEATRSGCSVGHKQSAKQFSEYKTSGMAAVIEQVWHPYRLETRWHARALALAIEEAERAPLDPPPPPPAADVPLPSASEAQLPCAPEAPPSFDAKPQSSTFSGEVTSLASRHRGGCTAAEAPRSETVSAPTSNVSAHATAATGASVEAPDAAEKVPAANEEHHPKGSAAKSTAAGAAAKATATAASGRDSSHHLALSVTHPASTAMLRSDGVMGYAHPPPALELAERVLISQPGMIGALGEVATIDEATGMCGVVLSDSGNTVQVTREHIIRLKDIAPPDATTRQAIDNWKAGDPIPSMLPPMVLPVAIGEYDVRLRLGIETFWSGFFDEPSSLEALCDLLKLSVPPAAVEAWSEMVDVTRAEHGAPPDAAPKDLIAANFTKRGEAMGGLLALLETHRPATARLHESLASYLAASTTPDGDTSTHRAAVLQLWREIYQAVSRDEMVYEVTAATLAEGSTDALGGGSTNTAMTSTHGASSSSNEATAGGGAGCSATDNGAFEDEDESDDGDQDGDQHGVASSHEQGMLEAARKRWAQLSVTESVEKLGHTFLKTVLAHWRVLGPILSYNRIFASGKSNIKRLLQRLGLARLGTRRASDVFDLLEKVLTEHDILPTTENVAGMSQVWGETSVVMLLYRSFQHLQSLGEAGPLSRESLAVAECAFGLVARVRGVRGRLNERALHEALPGEAAHRLVHTGKGEMWTLFAPWWPHLARK